MKNTLGEMIQNGLKKVTRDFTRAKMQAHGQRQDRISQWQIDRLENQNTERQLKVAAYEAIAQAYMAVSDNGRLPANVRQIFYQVRPLVIAATDGKIWKNSSTFTQGVFQDYLRDNPEKTSDWDIVLYAHASFLFSPLQKNTIFTGWFLCSSECQRSNPVPIGVDALRPLATNGSEKIDSGRLETETQIRSPQLRSQTATRRPRYDHKSLIS